MRRSTKTPTGLERLLRKEAAAEILDVEPRTLDDWRYRGRGPDYVLVGRCVRYEPEALARYIESRRRKSTSDDDTRRSA